MKMKKDSENQFEPAVLGHGTSSHTVLSAWNSSLISSFLVFLWGVLSPLLKHRSKLGVVKLISVPRTQQAEMSGSKVQDQPHSHTSRHPRTHQGLPLGQGRTGTGSPWLCGPVIGLFTVVG